MNISPNFKLGMNVKNMTHFSTTKDAVIFPEKMIEVVRTKSIEGNEGLLLEDVLLTAGMRWNEGIKFTAVSMDKEIDLSLEEMLNCYLIYKDGQASLYKDKEIMTDLIRIEKMKLNIRSKIQITATLIVIISCLFYGLYIGGIIDFRIVSIGDLNPYGDGPL